MDVPHFCVSCSIVDDSCKLTSHPCCPILYHTQNGVVLSFTEKGTLSDVDGDPPQCNWGVAGRGLAVHSLGGQHTV